MFQRNEAIDYILDVFERRREKVFESDLSSRSTSGIQYASAVLYAEYLGLRVIGRIPAWVIRARNYPNAVPPQLLLGINETLKCHGLKLQVNIQTGKGELIHL